MGFIINLEWFVIWAKKLNKIQPLYVTIKTSVSVFVYMVEEKGIKIENIQKKPKQNSD